MLNRLREIRKLNNKTGVEVAEYLNISSQFYYDLEAGKKRLSDEYLVRLVDLFKCSTDYILCRDVYLKANDKNIDLDSFYLAFLEKTKEKDIPIDKLMRLLDCL